MNMVRSRTASSYKAREQEFCIDFLKYILSSSYRHYRTILHFNLPYFFNRYTSLKNFWRENRKISHFIVRNLVIIGPIFKLDFFLSRPSCFKIEQQQWLADLETIEKCRLPSARLA